MRMTDPRYCDDPLTVAELLGLLLAVLLLWPVLLWRWIERKTR